MVKRPWRRIKKSSIFEKFWTVAGAASIRIKVLGIVMGLVTILGFFALIQMNAILMNQLTGELSHQGQTLAKSLAQDSAQFVADGDVAGLEAYLLAEQSHYSDDSHTMLVTSVRLEGSDSAVIARAPDLSMVAGFADATDFAQELEFVSELPDNQGTLRLVLSTRNIRQIVDRTLLQLAGVTLVMIVAGLGAALFLIWILTRPILELVAATHAVARGDYHQRVARWADDEVGELATAFNEMTASLEKAEAERAEREQLREQYVSGVIQAQESERQRIARELHDSTSQSLTSLLVGLQNLRHATSTDEVESQVAELRAVVGKTLEEVRTLSWRLRPRALDDLGLVSALQHYIEDYQMRYGIHVDYVASGLSQRLPSAIETTIYRIVQEGLTNIARYAGADHASVILTQRADGIRIIVEDDGVGFAPELLRSKDKSLGLQGIRERAGLFGGNLTIESQPGQGTSLFIELSVENLPDGEKTEQTV